VNSPDALIVGAGMAGLTAAAYLSRAGLKVLLCEKQAKTGGLVSSFESGGFVFDGGIRAMENSGIVFPMLRQLGIDIEFVPSTVAIGIGRDVIRVSSRASLADYQGLLERCFPESRADVAAIVREVARVMDYMAVLYGIDNPLFLDLRNNPKYVFRTILPWLVRYLLTMPRLTRLYRPVDDHLAGLSSNQALIDIIAQHFFRKTPAFFALSYFSLYLDYRYPKGGTGALPRALEQFVRARGGEIRTGTAITRIEPGRHLATDAGGGVCRYRRLIWAADLKTLYRVLDLTSLSDSRAVARIRARRRLLENKVGGDSVFTLYLTVNLAPDYFARQGAAHYFYTGSRTGLSHCPLEELSVPGEASGFSRDRAKVADWFRRYFDLTTYEISVPALRDPGLAPPGRTGLIVSSLFDYRLTRHVREMGWYDEFKRLVSDRIIDLLDRSAYPGIKAAVIDRFTSTPLTLERVAGNSDGAITGWAFTNVPVPAVNRLPLIARSVLTPIPDTYQAGQWTYSPSGMPISILTGRLAADRLIRGLH
jgi:phytoene dehydrogenase-like protein